MTIRTFLWALVCLCIPKVQSQEPLYRQPGAPIEDRVNDLLERMTLDEKIGQLCCPLGWPMYEKTGAQEVTCSEAFRQQMDKAPIGSYWATLRADPWTQKTLETGLNPELAAQYEEFWRSGNTAFTQIDWAALYEANLYNKRFGDGRAIYMVEERRSDLYETTFNATLDARLNRHSKLTGGITARNSISHQFKTVEDLLGADYLLDIDKFAEQDFPGDPNSAQSDLNRPNRRVTEGGVFGYDYNININSMRGWLVNNYNSRHWDGYYGFQLTYTDFYRDGKMRNGRYPTDSYGNGDHHKFTDVMLKGGLTWKINGRHLLSANIAYGSQAPLPYSRAAASSRPT